MRYYKIIADNTFVGVVHSGAFLQENPTSHKLRVSTENEGQFVEYEGKLYRDYWMRPIDTQRQYTICTIEEIASEEYNAIIAAIRNDTEIIVEEEEEDPIIEVLEPETEEEDITLTLVRYSKLSEMRKACHHAIEDGFELDGHHYSLETHDQLNLLNLSMMSGNVPYHADGEPYRYYSAAEIQAVIDAANAHKIYHTAYYNSLKTYIYALDNIEDIDAITYGVEIPAEYQSEVLASL